MTNLICLPYRNIFICSSFPSLPLSLQNIFHFHSARTQSHILPLCLDTRHLKHALYELLNCWLRIIPNWYKMELNENISVMLLCVMWCWYVCMSVICINVLVSVTPYFCLHTDRRNISLVVLYNPPLSPALQTL